MWRASLDPASYSIIYFIKNLFTIAFKPSHIYTDHSTQIFRSELPYHAYQPRSMLFGQRVGMLYQVVRSSDPQYHNLVLAAKLLEYAHYLQDPLPFMSSYCRCIKHHYPKLHTESILQTLKTRLPELSLSLHCYPAKTSRQSSQQPLQAFLKLYSPPPSTP